MPRDVNALPWNSGYAETINAGKSRQNEDQACVREGRISVVVGGQMTHIPYTLMSVYDGHAGAACAVAASNDLWQVTTVILYFKPTVNRIRILVILSTVLVLFCCCNCNYFRRRIHIS